MRGSLAGLRRPLLPGRGSLPALARRGAVGTWRGWAGRGVGGAGAAAAGRLLLVNSGPCRPRRGSACAVVGRW